MTRTEDANETEETPTSNSFPDSGPGNHHHAGPWSSAMWHTAWSTSNIFLSSLALSHSHVLPALQLR